MTGRHGECLILLILEYYRLDMKTVCVKCSNSGLKWPTSSGSADKGWPIPKSYSFLLWFQITTFDKTDILSQYTMTDLKTLCISAYSIERFDDKLPGLDNTILKFLGVLLNILDGKLPIYVLFHRHKGTLNLGMCNTRRN